MCCHLEKVVLFVSGNINFTKVIMVCFRDARDDNNTIRSDKRLGVTPDIYWTPFHWWHKKHTIGDKRNIKNTTIDAFGVFGKVKTTKHKSSLNQIAFMDEYLIEYECTWKIPIFSRADLFRMPCMWDHSVWRARVNLTEWRLFFVFCSSIGWTET